MLAIYLGMISFQNESYSYSLMAGAQFSTCKQPWKHASKAASSLPFATTTTAPSHIRKRETLSYENAFVDTDSPLLSVESECQPPKDSNFENPLKAI